jgi:hypothetical protein
MTDLYLSAATVGHESLVLALTVILVITNTHSIPKFWLF